MAGALFVWKAQLRLYTLYFAGDQLAASRGAELEARVHPCYLSLGRTGLGQGCGESFVLGYMHLSDFCATSTVTTQSQSKRAVMYPATLTLSLCAILAGHG